MVKDTRLYERLGVDPSATPAEIKRAFRKRAFKLHPDKNVSNPDNRDAKFIEAYQAYEILSDDHKRRLYDTQGPAGVFGRGIGVPTTEPDDEPNYRARPSRSPGTTPNYGGTSFNYRSYARDSSDDDDGDGGLSEEELRRIIDELLRKRYSRARRRGGGDGSAPLFSAEDIEDMLRPSFCAFIFLSLFDIAINVSAGAAAAAAGAHANGNVVTHRITSLGALAGLTKSGIVTFVGLTKYLHLGSVLDFLFQLLGSGFVVCLLVTLQVCGMALGQQSGALCGAALIAGIPLRAESMSHVAATRTYPSWLVYCMQSCICSLVIFWPLYTIAFDAFGGFVFALAAKLFGMPICALHAAAAAGAVYGTLTAVSRWTIGCCGCMCACCTLCMLSQMAEDN